MCHGCSYAGRVLVPLHPLQAPLPPFLAGKTIWLEGSLPEVRQQCGCSTTYGDLWHSPDACICERRRTRRTSPAPPCATELSRSLSRNTKLCLPSHCLLPPGERYRPLFDRGTVARQASPGRSIMPAQASRPWRAIPQFSWVWWGERTAPCLPITQRVAQICATTDKPLWRRGCSCLSVFSDSAGWQERAGDPNRHGSARPRFLDADASMPPTRSGSTSCRWR